jgi:phospholipid-translocating ATPase
MNQKQANPKMGLFDSEVNYLSKLLFVLLLVLSCGILVFNGFHGDWFIFFFRVILLLSSIIPISLRVNLDFAKLYYCYQINHDSGIKGAIARNSNIPEELGRIQFLVTDKTGTLTKNEMTCKKICTEYSEYDVDEQMVEI